MGACVPFEVLTVARDARCPSGHARKVPCRHLDERSNGVLPRSTRAFLGAPALGSYVCLSAIDSTCWTNPTLAVFPSSPRAHAPCGIMLYQSALTPFARLSLLSEELWPPSWELSAHWHLGGILGLSDCAAADGGHAALGS